jgi:O-antigen/teichoic acid export membrane protein
VGITRRIARNTSFNFINRSSDLVINFVVSIVLARGLGAEGYGTYALMVWFLGLSTLLVRLGLGDMAKRFIAEAGGKEDEALQMGTARMALWMRGLAALVVCALIIVFSRQWAALFGDADNQSLFMLVAIALFPNAVNLVLVGIFAGFQKYQYSAYLMLASNPLRAALIAVLMAADLGVREVLLANIGSWLIGMVVGVFLLRRLVPLRVLLSPMAIEPDSRRRALKYAMVVTGIMAVNYVLWQQAEVFILGLYAPVEQVGFYTLAAKVPAASVALLPTVLGTVLLPVVSEQVGRGDMEKLRRIYTASGRYLMALAFPLAAAGIALAGPIVDVLYGQDYAPVVLLLRILFLPAAMMGVAHAATSVIYGVNEPAFVLRVGAVLALVGIGLNLWLIPAYGAIGAAIGSSVPRLLLLPLYIRLASGRVGVGWPRRDAVKIGIASLIAGLALFGVQLQLGALPALLVSLLLGPMVYAGGLLLLRVPGRGDVEAMRSLQPSLPRRLRKSYATLILLVERAVRPGSSS